jgi:hypothetical protein
MRSYKIQTALGHVGVVVPFFVLSRRNHVPKRTEDIPIDDLVSPESQAEGFQNTRRVFPTKVYAAT